MGATIKCEIYKNVKKNRVIKLGEMIEKRKLSRVTPVSPTYKFTLRPTLHWYDLNEIQIFYRSRQGVLYSQEFLTYCPNGKSSTSAIIHKELEGAEKIHMKFLSKTKSFWAFLSDF
jgi:hypothetical protein